MVVGDFRATFPEPLAIQMIGIDCVAPEAGARVRLCTRTESNAWDNTRHHVTLGGRRNDETALKGQEILGEIWNLLLDEPEATADSSVSKPASDSTNVRHTSVIYSREAQPGKDLPDVRVYVPLWQYSSSNRTIAGNLEEVFRKQGWSWGTNGTYRKSFVDAFRYGGGGAVSDGTPIAFTHLSFNFSKKKGIYISSSLVPPCVRP
ncbi:hypothetical protein DL765_007011 [Monosporascus sp. GIB2]|nr:hypothetical protein DL765_007011 [Monosporascus sp. GIB2]